MSAADVEGGSTPVQSEETVQESSGRRQCAYRRCEETFKPSVPSQKYHSDSCRKREYEYRKMDEMAERVGRRIAERINDHLDDWLQEELEEEAGR